MPQKILVFDIETQREFAEVGGPQNKHLLGVSVVGCYDYADDKFKTFMEAELLEFAKLLRDAELIIGFNSKHFDLPVLQPYISLDTTQLPSLDLMEDLERILGHRVSLDACAEATLGAKKTGHGLEAIQWYRQGKFDLLKQYCLDDVRLTRDLFNYGRTHGQIFFIGRDGSKKSVPVSWGSGAAIGPDKIKQILKEAREKGQRVEIEYITMHREDGTHERNRRKIDIIQISNGALDAYCHLRQDTRRFILDRIVDARILEETTNPGLAVGQNALL